MANYSIVGLVLFGIGMIAAIIYAFYLFLKSCLE